MRDGNEHKCGALIRAADPLNAHIAKLTDVSHRRLKWIKSPRWDLESKSGNTAPPVRPLIKQFSFPDKTLAIIMHRFLSIVSKSCASGAPPVEKIRSKSLQSNNGSQTQIIPPFPPTKISPPKSPFVAENYSDKTGRIMQMKCHFFCKSKKIDAASG